MPQCRYKLFWLGLTLPLCFSPACLPACNVPVFRYALERWIPDPYIVVLFEGQVLAPDEQALLEPITKASQSGAINSRVRMADVSGVLPGPFRALWGAQQNPKLPWVVVRYPAQTGIEPSVWAGPLTREVATDLMDSPARQELGRRLLSGDTAVWLLLEGSDAKMNDAMEHLLSSESKRLMQTLALPEPQPDDPEISPDLPLRIAFSTLRISRSNPAERMLVRQLLSWHPGLANESRPMLYPVFGRGRVLPPAVGDGIKPEGIETMARLLTGPCSCQIKEMNAGFDLLMKIDWGQAFSTKSARAAAEPPMLVGLSQFAASTTNGRPPVRAAPQFASSGRLPASGTRDHMFRNLAVLAALAAVFLSVTSVVLRSKTGRGL
jgi:hypothetical protein